VIHLLSFLQTSSVPDFTPYASLGVGGILAAVMFWAYRNDRQSSERKFAEYRDAMDRRYDELARDFKTIVQENTEASAKLAAVIERVLDSKR